VGGPQVSDAHLYRVVDALDAQRELLDAASARTPPSVSWHPLDFEARNPPAREVEVSPQRRSLELG
jgi:hypothetical protein